MKSQDQSLHPPLNKAAFQFTWALVPLLLGVGLPYIGLFGARYLNLPWSMAYGSALFAADLMGVHLALNRAAGLFGGLIWPIFLTVILYWSSGRAWRVISPLMQRISLTVLVVLGFVVVDLDRIYHPPFDWLPTYWKYMFIIW